LGTGAHLIALRRIGVGNLHIDEGMTIAVFEALPEENRKNHLLPVDRLLSDLIALILPPAQASRFLQGQRLALEKEGVDYPNRAVERVKVVDIAQTLLGVASLSSEGTLQPERLVSMNSIPKKL
jgi:tRNA pseudouridine55 synthase